MRAVIAGLVLESAPSQSRLGTVRLAPHQLEAVSRIHRALDDFGGALLCDVVGSGKTYVGLAVGAAARSAVVIIPAALRAMWIDAIRRAAISVRCVSMESLSRSCPELCGADLLIVDEAHHFRNASTRRHRCLARLVTGRRVLLMTATPIHNSRTDLVSLASLFLGARARRLSEHDLSRLVVRRTRTTIAASARMPQVAPVSWLRIGDDAALVSRIMKLPPAVPPREAGEAPALTALGLVRQWASSEAALRAALRRRIARAHALAASLEAGDFPSLDELASWIAGDDAIQLGFAGMLAPPSAPNSAELFDGVLRHRVALDELLSSMPATSPLDELRAHLLSAIASKHSSAPIVAFTSYEATAVALFKKVAAGARAAALTARGALVAGGRVARADVIGQFDPGNPPPAECDRIRLLITTDLLSEGVNLQTAQVIVHLDIPWTPARLDQRVGRLARVGSPHERIIVYAFKPPSSADGMLRLSSLIETKRSVERGVIGRGSDVAKSARERVAPVEAHESLRRTMRGWTTTHQQYGEAGRPLAAAVNAETEGFLCVLEQGAQATMICSLGAAISESPSDLARACGLAAGANAQVEQKALRNARQRIAAWLRARESAEVAGLGAAAFLSSRRKILARISAVAAKTAPNVRPRRADLIRSARLSATATLGKSAEDDFAALASKLDDTADTHWLHEVARIGAHRQQRDSEERYRLRALILFQRDA